MIDLAPFQSTGNKFGFVGVCKCRYGSGYTATLKLGNGKLKHMKGAGRGFTIPEAAMAYARAYLKSTVNLILLSPLQLRFPASVPLSKSTMLTTSKWLNFSNLLLLYPLRFPASVSLSTQPKMPPGNTVRLY